MKIRSVILESLHADRPLDRQRYYESNKYNFTNFVYKLIKMFSYLTENILRLR
jgi:hypothetical protein